MISRFYSLDSQHRSLKIAVSGISQSRVGRRQLVGWVTLVVLSFSYGFWIAYRLIGQPDWPATLPTEIGKLIELAEMASAVTLAFLWMGLYWRYRRNRAPSTTASPTIDQLLSLSPKAFEQYVAALFRRKGYKATVRGRSGDHGVDIELLNPVGRRAIVQCKRYQNTVGEDTVRELYGTIIHEQAIHGFLVTTAEISDAAHVWSHGKPITLVDGATLVQIAAALDEASPR